MKSRFRYRASGMAIGAALFAGGGSAYASDTVTLTDENLLILRLRTDRYVLSEGVIGYQTPGGACVLLDDLVAGLEFEITSHDFDFICDPRCRNCYFVDRRR